MKTSIIDNLATCRNEIRDCLNRFIRMEKNKVLLREILWCGQNGHYVEIHTEKRGVFRFRLPFGEFSR